MNDMNEGKRDIENLVGRFEQALDSGYMANFEDEELVDLFDFYFDNLDLQRAEMVVDVWGKLYPMDDERKLSIAKIMVKRGEYEEALVKLDEIRYYDDSNVFLYRGLALLELNKVDEAVEEFNKAVAHIDKDDEYRVFYEISVALERKNFGSQAYEYLKKANELYANDLDILNDLVAFTFRNERYKDCAAYCNKVLDIDPYQKEAWVYLGFSYDSLGNKDKALEALEYAEAISDEVEIACLRVGLLIEMNRIDEAESYLKQSLESADDKLPLLKLLAECYEKQQDYENMYKTYSEIVKMDDEEQLDDNMLVYAYSAFISGHYKETIEITNKLLQTDPFNEYAMVYKADALFYEYDDTVESERLYRQVLKLDPDNYDAYHGLGVIAFANEDYKSTIQYLTKVCEMSGENESCMIYIAAAYFYMGDEASMLTYIKKALSLSNEAVSKFFELCPEAFEAMQKYL